MKIDGKEKKYLTKTMQHNITNFVNLSCMNGLQLRNLIMIQMLVSPFMAADILGPHLYLG